MLHCDTARFGRSSLLCRCYRPPKVQERNVRKVPGNSQPPVESGSSCLKQTRGTELSRETSTPPVQYQRASTGYACDKRRGRDGQNFAQSDQIWERCKGFEQLDTNQDGFLNYDELQKVLELNSTQRMVFVRRTHELDGDASNHMLV